MLAKIFNDRMIKTGVVNLPLHYGSCPKWLFEKMKSLAGIISEVIVYEYGQEEYLKRLSNPFFFQALGCVLSFDWHSSGLTTTVCGALKESLNKLDLGIKIAGGKGKASRKTMEEIESNDFSLSDKEIEKLKYASKMSARVDNNCVQDGYQLYHHSFIFTEKGKWVVIQQGMNVNYARRYHWVSDNLNSFVEEPHFAVCGDKKEENVLDMTCKENEQARKASVDLVKDNPNHLKKYFTSQRILSDFCNGITFPKHHPISLKDIGENGMKVLQKAYEIQPENYEELVALKGMGPKKIRALALISNLVFGTEIKWKDPVKYTFTHGGKDGFPYPVDRETYNNSILTLKEAIEQAKLDNKEKINAVKRLGIFL